MRYFLSSLILLAFSSGDIFAQEADADAARQAYLAKRAAEKEAAEKAVKELSVRDYATLGPDDFIRLCLAYNELADNRLALDAICRVPDETLAAKKQLDLKAICYQNVTLSDDKSVRIRELAFIDRCLDKKWGNQGVWLMRKARIVCQASVALEVPTRGDNIGSPAHIVDHEQYEYAFELLKRAAEVEPKLLKLWQTPAFAWEQEFPMLHREPRFQALMEELAK